MVYSGYYFLLTLIFVGAGVYKLTVVGWWKAVKTCWMKEDHPRPPATSQSSQPVHVQNVLGEDAKIM